jgi:hypothetical protein
VAVAVVVVDIPGLSAQAVQAVVAQVTPMPTLQLLEQ